VNTGKEHGSTTFLEGDSIAAIRARYSRNKQASGKLADPGEAEIEEQ
jgi:hypothetical protein